MTKKRCIILENYLYLERKNIMHNILKLVVLIGFILYLFIGFSFYTSDYFKNPTYDCANGVTAGGIFAPTRVSKECIKRPYFSLNLFSFLVFWPRIIARSN